MNPYSEKRRKGDSGREKKNNTQGDFMGAEQNRVLVGGTAESAITAQS